MDISISNINSGVLIKITGSVKLKDAETLDDVFVKIIETSEKQVSLDLSNVPAISSLGIGKIIFLHHQLKKRNRRLVVSGINKNLLSLFSTMKLDKVFNIQDIDPNK